MFFKKSFLFILAAVSLCTFSCDLFNSFSEEDNDNNGNPVSQFYLNSNSLSVATGFFETVSITCKPESAQSGLNISWSYDNEIIDVIPDNFKITVYGKKPGSTSLTASANGYSSACVITVTGSDALAAVTPYVYSNTSFVQLTPNGEQVHVTASLAGGTPNDVSGFSFEAEQQGIVAVVSEGNSAWLSGLSAGMTRITVRHSRSSFPYTFIVSCSTDNLAVPYITTDSNIVSVNKTLTKETSFSVGMINSNPFIYDNGYSYSLLDHNYNPASDPPVSISANGKQCVVTPLKSGECFIRVTHSSPDVFYPLDILVIVYEQIDNAYIDIPEPIVYVNGSNATVFSVSIVNLPADVYADPSDFSWSFPDNFSEFIDFNVFGGGYFGTGNSLWLSGKKSGSFPVSVSHPLAALPRKFYVVVNNINTEGVDASSYISTSQNYVLSSAGSDPVTIGVTLYNFNKGDEHSLLWSVANSPKDNSSNPVIEYVAATGSYSGSSISGGSRSVSTYVPITTGELTIKPLREGSAVISISHPKAFYDTKILVTVLSETSTVETKPFLLSSETSHVTLVNGNHADIAVSLEGYNVRASDESDIAWSSSNPALAISASGSTARITPTGSGLSKYTVSVSHPKAQMPLTITVISYDNDNPDQISTAKYVTAVNYDFLVEEGQSSYVSAIICNREPSDTLIWNVTSGLNSVISIAQIDPSVISVTGLKSGFATVTASIANNTDPTASATFHVMVSSKSSQPSQAAYLSTSDNVVILDAAEQKTVTVSSVNIPLDNQISWSDYDSSLIDVIPNIETAVIRAKGKTGSTSVTVSHPKSANTLSINVRVGDRYVYNNTDVPYIAVSDNIISFAAGDTNFRFYALLAHTEKQDTSVTGFSFSVSNPSIASLEYVPGQNTVSVIPLAAGQAILTVSHKDAPDVQVPIIVNRAADGSSPAYITSKQNIVTVISGGTATVSVSLVNALSYNNSDWSWFSSNNSSVSIVANNGSTAIIRGYNPGQVTLTVSHNKTSHPLTITVLCVDSAVAASQPWINTNFSILTLKTNSSETLTAQMIGGSGADNNSFVFTVSDPRVLFISQSSDGAYLRGVSQGTATVTVINTMYPVTNPGNRKSVLVIVELAVNNDAYISVDKSFVALQPDSNSSAMITASLSGTGTSSADNYSFSWWADDYSVIYLNSVANSASIVPTGKTGVTSVHVKHPKAAYSVDIIVTVSKYTQFAFAETSKYVTKGGASFISMCVPPQSGSFKINYSSLNPSVCEIVGSNSTAMIAGITNGQTTVSASLVVGSQTVATAELAVIVANRQADGNTITVPNAIVNMEVGQQQTLKALLSGKGVTEQDKYNILWKSDNPSVASLLATENKLTKGPEALVTAVGPGETVIAVSHDKVIYEISSLHPKPDVIEEFIHIVVPQKNEKIISLNQTNIVLFKDDPDFKISASILNGSQSDYSQITWSAPRVSGQNIVSIRGNGKDCNIHPLNTGATTIRAQLPNGIYADCVVSVQSTASISFSKNAVHLNPGYSETINYSVNPDNSQIMWNEFINGSMPNDFNPNNYFSFNVNESNKTITVTAHKIGNGYVQAIMLSGGSNVTAKFNIFVEYNYSFDLDTNNVITAEPFPDTIIDIPYHCFPPDLNVQIENMNEYQNFVSLYTSSHNSVAGNGVIKLKTLKEKNNVVLRVKANNPKDPGMTPIVRQVTLNMVYKNITVTPVFNTQVGAYSRFLRTSSGSWQLYLGDGEDVLFSLDIDQKNADVGGIEVEYQPTSTGNQIKYSTNKITISREINNDTLYRIKHNEDVVLKNEYYYITKDLEYRDLKIEREQSIPVQTLIDTIKFPIPTPAPNVPPETVYLYNQSFPSPTTVITNGPTRLQAKLNQGLTGSYPNTSFSDPVFQDILCEECFVPHIYEHYMNYSVQWFNTTILGGNAAYFVLHYSNYIDHGDRVMYLLHNKEGPQYFQKGKKELIYLGPPYANVQSPVSGRVSSVIGGTGGVWDIKKYSFTIHYEPCTPYIISKKTFQENPNYYYADKQLHLYAKQIDSPVSNVVEIHDGLLTVTYSRMNKTEQIIIKVITEIRDCSAFSKDKWVEGPAGTWTSRW